MERFTDIEYLTLLKDYLQKNKILIYIQKKL